MKVVPFHILLTLNIFTCFSTTCVSVLRKIYVGPCTIYSFLSQSLVILCDLNFLYTGHLSNVTDKDGKALLLKIPFNFIKECRKI